MSRSRHSLASTSSRPASVALVLALSSVVALPAIALAAPATERISVSTAAVEGNGDSFTAAISRSGRYVAFASAATTLVVPPSNGLRQIFIHDRKTDTTSQVSVSSAQVEGAQNSSHPSVSGDGRFVVFASIAKNLVGNDTNGQSDVFMRDRQKNQTKRMSLKSNGKQARNGSSTSPVISQDGRFIAFASKATNLVNGDTNGDFDVFVRNRRTGAISRVSVTSKRKQRQGDSTDPAISADGRFIAFRSEARLVKKDRNGRADIYVHDRKTRKTTLVSVRSNGRVGRGGDSTDPSISTNGRYVAFDSGARNLVDNDTNKQTDVFVHDRKSKKTKRVSLKHKGGQVSDEGSFNPSISADGRFVAFRSNSDQLVASDAVVGANVFIRDRKRRRTRLLDLDGSGAQGNQLSTQVSLTPDARFAAFTSSSTDLVGDDKNFLADIFVRGPLR